MARPRVLLVDDHGLVRAGLKAMLEQHGIVVVGEASDGREALERIAALAPDVVLMDLSMPGFSGLEALRRAVAEQPRLKVIVVSMHSDREYVRQALAAGAAGYLMKSADPSELADAIAAVGRGELWLSSAMGPSAREELMRGLKGAPRSELSPRQREVLQLISEGQSTKQIARRLGVSVKTVETHRAQIMERLDIRHVAGLTRYAIRAGLVSPHE